MSNKATKSDTKDIGELKGQISALKAVANNPINLAPIVALVAPIIARIAARRTAGYLANQWNKRATPKIRTEVAQKVAENITGMLAGKIK